MNDGLDVVDLLRTLKMALQEEYRQTQPFAHKDPLRIDASSNRPCCIPPVLRLSA
jgi:hypothetical protein